MANLTRYRFDSGIRLYSRPLEEPYTQCRFDSCQPGNGL